MKIKLNKIDFDIAAVPGKLRTAILQDESAAPALASAVWEWNAETGESTTAQGIEKGRMRLPNGLIFFVPKNAEGPRPERNDGATKKMGERFVSAVGAKSLGDVAAALNRVLGTGEVKIPEETYAPLKAGATFRIIAHLDFAVLQMRAGDRNLAAHILLPGQVVFRPLIVNVTDQAAHDAVLEEHPGLDKKIQAAVLPPRSKAAMDMRQLALGSRFKEAQTFAARLEKEGADEERLRLPKMEMQRLGAEAKVLSQIAAGGKQPGRPVAANGAANS
ncbi:hypothetical protein [Pseudoroseicyclus tamaricis]|uniref:Uncharacterized protein n=1 Tax=Pseudoroseicyclus tamaricis TaxID=2705421 RepID=A0A6B2JTX1_9RHOB|nr:hypothetical protein [Pseudoroseicyclus tamaricis]NDU99623.1 hypothetical protein [Pseudoroseicyclus tamaricis]